MSNNLKPVLFPDKYAVRFIPRENGIHTIDVKFNGSHVPGSPFKVRVGEPGQEGDPALVTAYGAGLERGITGRQMLTGLNGDQCKECISRENYPVNRLSEGICGRGNAWECDFFTGCPFTIRFSPSSRSAKRRNILGIPATLLDQCWRIFVLWPERSLRSDAA